MLDRLAKKFRWWAFLFFFASCSNYLASFCSHLETILSLDIHQRILKETLVTEESEP